MVTRFLRARMALLVIVPTVLTVYLCAVQLQQSYTVSTSMKQISLDYQTALQILSVGVFYEREQLILNQWLLQPQLYAADLRAHCNTTAPNLQSVTTTLGLLSLQTATLRFRTQIFFTTLGQYLNSLRTVEPSRVAASNGAVSMSILSGFYDNVTDWTSFIAERYADLGATYGRWETLAVVHEYRSVLALVRLRSLLAPVFTGGSYNASAVYPILGLHAAFLDRFFLLLTSVQQTVFQQAIVNSQARTVFYSLMNEALDGNTIGTNVSTWYEAVDNYTGQFAVLHGLLEADIFATLAASVAAGQRDVIVLFTILIVCVLFVSVLCSVIMWQISGVIREALASSKLKSQFLATVTHELRTPLNGVIGTVQLMDGPDLSPERADMMHTIRTSAELLLLRIDEILEFSNLEAGNVTLQHDSMDIRMLLEDLVAIFLVQVQHRSLEIRLCIDECVPQIAVGDPDRLRQVLMHLLSNAVKFTSEGYVELHAFMRGDSFVFDVTDTGMGISDDAMSQLFVPFYQAEGSFSRRFGGTGIGLPIARRLVELMQGDLSVQSQLGKGSTFSFWVKFMTPRRQPRLVTPISHMLIISDQCKYTQHLFWRLPVTWAHWPDMSVLASVAADIQHIFVDVPESDLGRVATILAKIDVPMTILWRGGNVSDVPPNASVWRRIVTTRSRVLAWAAAAASDASSPEPAAKVVRTLTPTFPVEQISEVQVVPRDSPPPIMLPGRVTPPQIMPLSEPQLKKLMQVLVAEDNPVNARVCSLMLTRLDCVATVVPNGLLCLEAFRSGEYSLILMDLQMPVLDGYEATKRLREGDPPDGARVPIVAVTANTLPQDKERCFETGMNGFVPKPLRIDQLASAIRDAIPGWIAPPLSNPSSGFSSATASRRVSVVELTAPRSFSVDPTSTAADTKPPVPELINSAAVSAWQERRASVQQHVADTGDETAPVPQALVAKQIAPIAPVTVLSPHEKSNPAPSALLFPSAAAATSQMPSRLSSFSSLSPLPRLPHVLVVEDNIINQRVCTQMLSKLGFRSSVADNGQICLDLLTVNSDIVAVLMDLQMPVMDGFEATRRIRAQERTTGSHLPIIAVTSNTLAQDVGMSLAVGMDAFIGKPLNLEVLRTKLGEFIPPWSESSLSSSMSSPMQSETHSALTSPNETGRNSPTLPPSQPSPTAAKANDVADLLQKASKPLNVLAVAEQQPKQEPSVSPTNVAVRGLQGGMRNSPGEKSFIRETHVLVVEDNLINQRVCVQTLKKLGCKVTVADNGRICLDVLRKTQDIALILMDLQMPVMDGFEATQRIRRRERKSGLHIPIVAVTANTLVQDVEKCFAVGMDAFVGKPIRLDALRAKLSALVPDWTPTDMFV